MSFLSLTDMLNHSKHPCDQCVDLLFDLTEFDCSFFGYSCVCLRVFGKGKSDNFYLYLDLINPSVMLTVFASMCRSTRNPL